MLRRRRSWHDPEPSGWRRALRGLLTAAVGIGIPLALFFVMGPAITPRPGPQPPPPELGRAAVEDPAGELDGSWTLDPEASWVGYRIQEELPRLRDLFDAVGRTDEVAGALEVSGAKVTAGWVEADLFQLESDSERRDRAIQVRYLESEQYPDARFELSERVGLLDTPEPGVPVEVPVVGELTLRETTRTVRPRLRARWDGERIRVVGALDVTLADYDIRAPRLPGFRNVEDEGVIEINLTFRPDAPD